MEVAILRVRVAGDRSFPVTCSSKLLALRLPTTGWMPLGKELRHGHAYDGCVVPVCTHIDRRIFVGNISSGTCHWGHVVQLRRTANAPGSGSGEVSTLTALNATRR